MRSAASLCHHQALVPGDFLPISLGPALQIGCVDAQYALGCTILPVKSVLSNSTGRVGSAGAADSPPSQPYQLLHAHPDGHIAQVVILTMVSSPVAACIALASLSDCSTFVPPPAATAAVPTSKSPGEKIASRRFGLGIFHTGYPLPIKLHPLITIVLSQPTV